MLYLDASLHSLHDGLLWLSYTSLSAYISGIHICRASGLLRVLLFTSPMYKIYVCFLLYIFLQMQCHALSCCLLVELQEKDSNLRLPAKETGELPTALSCYVCVLHRTVCRLGFEPNNAPALTDRTFL